MLNSSFIKEPVEWDVYFATVPKAHPKNPDKITL